ncbi:MAG: DUF1461 domain-containing protein, partial [Nanoarchaeota archaeon]|nr:DUF1461 domain-containing protein [Nanoarchaeota archaeon]
MKPHNYAVIFLPFVIILSNFALLLFSDSFFHERFDRYGAYDKLGKVVADKELDGLQHYFVSSEETLQASLLSSKERIHMLEVRDIIRLVLFLWVSISLLFLLSSLLHPQWSKVLWRGGLLVLPLLLLLYAFSFDFASNFVAFHQLFFQDSSWLLSSDSMLITLFPQQLFADFVFVVLIRSLIVGGCCIAIGWFFQRFKSSNRRLFGRWIGFWKK